MLLEVLPVDARTNHETIRRHLHETAERMENELGDERQLKLFAEEVEQEDLAPPDGPITVGIDGGYVRAAHQGRLLRSDSRPKCRRVSAGGPR